MDGGTLMLKLKNYFQTWIAQHNKAWIRMYFFFKTLILTPKTIGAIVPSSPYLARAMASYIPRPQKGVVIELGAGTGVITEAILKRGIHPNDLVLIESSPDFANTLSEEFSSVAIMTGFAQDLVTLLKNESRPVIAIVSSLPLRSLEPETTKRILAQIPQVLDPQGVYIQFTYDIRKTLYFYPSNYQLIDSQIVWKNIPPAKVEVYRIAAM